jgi:hypothetical protein
MPTPFSRPVTPGAVPPNWLDAVNDLHAACRQWTEPHPEHRPYVDLLFAFGFATLGDHGRARRLLAEARAVMQSPVPPPSKPNKEGAATPAFYDPVVAALVPPRAYAMFEWRVEQAAAGRSLAGELSAAVLDRLDELLRRADTLDHPHKSAIYTLDVLRSQSRVLDPDQRIDPNDKWTVRRSGAADLSDLIAAREGGRLDEAASRLYRAAETDDKEPRDRLSALIGAVLRGVGPEFPAARLEVARAVLAGATGDASGYGRDIQFGLQCRLLRRALYAAAASGRADLTRELAELFAALVRRFPPASRVRLTKVAGWQCVRSLQVSGLSDTLRSVTNSLSCDLSGARPARASRETTSAFLCARLVPAIGRLTLGMGEDAELGAARVELLTRTASDWPSMDYLDLARSYVTALGQGGAESGMPRLVELFREMPAGVIQNYWSTAPYFSRLHLNLTEDAVAAACRMLLERPQAAIAP